jgi:hypothetical protein
MNRARVELHHWHSAERKVGVTVERGELDALEQAWNPFSWRLRQLAALGSDPRHADRRHQLVDEVLLAEADEVVQGIRHVAVVHGDPTTFAEADQVDIFLAQMEQLLETSSWHRRRGRDDHVIVSIGGADAEERAGQIAALAELANPGHWTITETARPDLQQ